MPGLYYLSGKLILYIVNVLRVCNTAQILRLGEAGSTENHGDLDVNGHVCINSHRHSDVGWLSVSNTSSPSFFLRGALLRASGHDGSGAGPCATEADGEEGNGQSSGGRVSALSTTPRPPWPQRARPQAEAGEALERCQCAPRVRLLHTQEPEEKAGVGSPQRAGGSFHARRRTGGSGRKWRLWRPLSWPRASGVPLVPGKPPGRLGGKGARRLRLCPGERTPKQVRWAFLSRFLSVRSCLTLFPTAAGAFVCSSKNMPA